MNETIFSKILSGELPSYKIYEDEDVYAFLDISQVTPGHTLVIPKEASMSLLETKDEIAAKVFSVASVLARDIVAKLNADGCNIVTNAHESAGQEVMHFHVHILPRFDKGDNVFKIIQRTEKPTAEDLSAIQQQIVK